MAWKYNQINIDYMRDMKNILQTIKNAVDEGFSTAISRINSIYSLNLSDCIRSQILALAIYQQNFITSESLTFATVTKLQIMEFASSLEQRSIFVF